MTASQASSVPAAPLPEPAGSRWAGGPLRPSDGRLLAGLSVLVFAVYSTYALVRHDRFLTTGFDLGIFDQAVRGYSRFGPPIVPLKAPGYNLLGDHFHPIIALWAPLYWIWDDPRTLLLAQAALIAASMWPVAAFTARRLGSPVAVLVALLYGLSWPLQRMVQFDVHEIAFAIPLIAVVVDAIDRRARRTTVLACLGLLATREDMGIFVLLAGLLVATLAVRPVGPDRSWRPRRDDLVTGAVLVALGVAGYELATSVVIPYFSGGVGFVYWTFPALGPDLPSAIAFALRQPWSVLLLMVSPARKAQTLLAIGMPTLYACLGSRYALLTLPFLAQRLLNSRELLWSTNFHYSSVLAPIVVPAAVDTVAGLTRTVRARGWRLPGLGWGAEAVVPAWLTGASAVLVLGLLSQAGDYPVGRLWTADFWQRDQRVQAIDRVLSQLPAGVCVEADNAIAPHLTTRDVVTRVGLSDNLATWMVLDFSRADTGWQGVAPRIAYADALARGFEPVVQDDVIVLLRRPGVADTGCRPRTG